MKTGCLECGEKLTGRVDKKFCSDQCRNTYNNRLNQDSTNMMRNINRILKKNRRILESLNKKGKTRVTRQRLMDEGFNFDYLTNVFTTKTGNTYFFCYDQGYIQNENDFYTIVKRQDYVN
ncbi:MAG: hypothetical protein KBB11_00800 [Bacteroidales bacterium]|nr:hypothetical protein [Bacteroidales bacterium]HOY38680.1 hypothetical protein [Bacteroidales bacterium]HQP04033.1 hypothetical protein [Bacteroidales bacterium]